MAVARSGSVPGMEAAPAIFCREPVSVLGSTLEPEHEAGFHAAWLLRADGTAQRSERTAAERRNLLLSGGELTGQLLIGRAELITFLLNGGDLLTDSLLVTGGLSSLSGELIDLSVQLIDLTLELLILGGQRAVGFLGFAELGRDKLCCLIIASLSGLLGLEPQRSSNQHSPTRVAAPDR